MRRHLTYANVVSTLALCLVVSGGGAYAANQLSKNCVKSKHIAPACGFTPMHVEKISR